jgi:hypothetical protein
MVVVHSIPVELWQYTVDDKKRSRLEFVRKKSVSEILVEMLRVVSTVEARELRNRTVDVKMNSAFEKGSWPIGEPVVLACPSAVGETEIKLMCLHNNQANWILSLTFKSNLSAILQIYQQLSESFYHGQFVLVDKQSNLH